ncbi:hypothetical protein PBI_DEWDROP_124 [Microbacterium phage Dewdrop]|nr:hypothetical protein PBI_LEAF_124 [Microbacterium phage Leaf]QGZ17492.1 hypothetical protein PBI_DEWDROP_124 [Microbacterium phage Dewdrop]
MSTEIHEYAITFGVQYKPFSEFMHEDEKHPLGMHGNGYAVIEAPDREMARGIAFAIFGKQWSFDYELAEILGDERKQQFYPDGELLRIAWQTPEMVKRILDEVERITEGLPSRDPLYETAQGERTEFAKGRDKRLAEERAERLRDRPRMDSFGNPVVDEAGDFRDGTEAENTGGY